MYKTFDAVKEDYLIGEIMTNGEELNFTCKINSANYSDFIERYQNNDFVVSRKSIDGIVSIIVRYPFIEYNVMGYGYIASKDIWFPIGTHISDFEDFLYDNEPTYPQTYNEVMNSIKNSNKTILSNTIEE